MDDLVVVGAGGLGRTMSVLLAAAGQRVTLFARPSTAKALTGAGQLAVRGSFEARIEVTAGGLRGGALGVVADPADLPPEAAVLFTTKAHQLDDAARMLARSWLRDAKSGWWTAGVQNGLASRQVLAAAFGDDRVVGAATLLTAHLAADGTAEVTSPGSTFFGEFDGTLSDRVRDACGTFGRAGLPAVASGEIQRVLWSKMCNAAAVFGVTALTGLPTSRAMRHPSLVRAYRMLLEESAAVAVAEGLPPGDYPDLPIASLLSPPIERFADERARAQRARGTAGPAVMSSMAHDRRSGRTMESAEIFGDLSARGRRTGVATPLIDFAGDLLSGLNADLAERPRH